MLNKIFSAMRSLRKHNVEMISQTANSNCDLQLIQTFVLLLNLRIDSFCYGSDYGCYFCTLLKVPRQCSHCHWSWGWRTCPPSYAEVPCGTANVEEFMFNDPESCLLKRSQQTSLFVINPSPSLLLLLFSCFFGINVIFCSYFFISCIIFVLVFPWHPTVVKINLSLHNHSTQ